MLVCIRWFCSRPFPSAGPGGPSAVPGGGRRAIYCDCQDGPGMRWGVAPQSRLGGAACEVQRFTSTHVSARTQMKYVHISTHARTPTNTHIRTFTVASRARRLTSWRWRWKRRRHCSGACTLAHSTLEHAHHMLSNMELLRTQARTFTHTNTLACRRDAALRAASADQAHRQLAEAREELTRLRAELKRMC